MSFTCSSLCVAYPNLGVAPNRFFHINLDLLVGYLGKSDPKTYSDPKCWWMMTIFIPWDPNPAKITNKSKLIFTLQLLRSIMTYFLKPELSFFWGFPYTKKETAPLQAIACNTARAPQRVIARLMYCNIHIVVFLSSRPNKKKPVYV